jgi:hypothetical protein
MAADFLQLTIPDHPTVHAVWRGSWPPPERLGVVVGESGPCLVFDADHPNDLDAEVTAKCRVVMVRRTEYSKLPDAVRESQYVARGARYVVDDRPAYAPDPATEINVPIRGTVS